MHDFRHRTELVTTPKRKAADRLSDIERDKESICIALIEGVARGELAIAEGRVASHAQARKRLARWLGSSGRSPLSDLCNSPLSF